MTNGLSGPLTPCTKADSYGRIPPPAIGKCGNDTPDEELVQRSLKGEEDAFRLLYERYQRPVFAVACRIIPDPEEARDTTQEIFFTIYRSLALWSPQRARLISWIYRISINCAIDHWRVLRRRSEIQWDDKTEKVIRHISPGQGNEQPVERTLEFKERAARMHSYLRELPRQQRQFFILRYYQGLKLREIARKEGFKLETVKSSLYRTTHAMKRRLELGNNQPEG